MAARGLIAAASLVLSSCTVPPVTTTEQSFTVPYAMIVPGFALGVPLPLGQAAFSDRPTPASTVNVPREARTLHLGSASLNLKFLNTGPLPLRLKVYLARPGAPDLYATEALGGEQAVVELSRNSLPLTRTFSIDPALLQEETLKLGCTFSSVGSKEPVTFQAGDGIVVTHALTAQVKLN